ncbi:MAG: glycosyltransferase [Solirubrobacterales bacterium]
MQRDKRTFQVASSLGRLGYAPTVVEGEPSALASEQLPFELVTVSDAESLRDQGGDSETPVPQSAAAPSATERPRSHPLVEAMPRPVSMILKRIGADVLRLRLWWNHEYRLARVLLRSYRRDNELTLEALPNADLYYLTFFWQFPAVWRMCKRTGARFVYDANDAYWAWPGYRWYPHVFKLLLRMVERRCVRRADSFVTVSEGVAGLLERRYGRRPLVVRNLHDMRLDEECSADVRRASGLERGTFLLVVAGNEKPSDAVTEALQALARLPDRVHLTLMGSGYEKHAGEVERLGLTGRVHLLAPVAPTEVTSAIATADVAFVNTRAGDVHLHALPTRFFSAVAAGLPILYPPLPEVRALAEEHGLGLQVDAEDPDSIVAAVLALSESPELLDQYKANVERARQVLSWEHEEARLAEMVRSAIQNG